MPQNFNHNHPVLAGARAELADVISKYLPWLSHHDLFRAIDLDIDNYLLTRLEADETELMVYLENRKNELTNTLG